MTAMTHRANPEHEIVLTRSFDAPRESVWSAWTDPHEIAQWWGPTGFATRVEQLDLRPGGRFRYVMIAADGSEYPSSGVFREVVPGQRTVATDEFDEGFEVAEMPVLPQGMVVTCLFEDQGGGTRLTLRIAHPSAEDRRKHEEMGVIGGWQSSFDRLDEHQRKRASGA